MSDQLDLAALRAHANELRAERDTLKVYERTCEAIDAIVGALPGDGLVEQVRGVVERNAALQAEVERLRAFVEQATALEWGCPSGDCPHATERDCSSHMRSTLKSVAQDAASALVPRAAEKEGECK